MTLTIVLVSYNTVSLLRDCLASVYQHLPAVPCDVTVVDNASRDDSVAMVRAEFPQARVIANRENVGYAAAINQALQGLTADYALILNSDIEVPAGALDGLLQFMESHPEVGMAGPQLILPGGQLQETWGEGFSLGEFARQQLFIDKVLRPRPAAALAGEFAEVSHLHGAALLVRSAALRQVGLMDEGYWMYCEDSDWGRRFLAAGWKLALVTGTPLLHHHGASSRTIRGEMIAAYNLAAARYFRLHAGDCPGLAARALGLLGTSLRLLGAAVGTALTLGLCGPLRRRMVLFGRALGLQVAWRARWRQGPRVPVLEPDESA